MRCIFTTHVRLLVLDIKRPCERQSNLDVKDFRGSVINPSTLLDALPLHAHRLRRTTHPKKPHTPRLHIRPIPKPPTNHQPPFLIAHTHLRSAPRRDRLAIVDVEAPTRFAAAIRRDYELEVLIPQLRRRHRAIPPERQHRASSYMERNLGVPDIVQGEGSPLTLYGGHGVEVVEDVFWEIERDGGRVLVCDRGHEDGVAEEEL